MAAEIKGKLGVDPELVKSGGGAFEVVADGVKIFSKLQEGRFPTRDEIIALLDG